VQDHLDSRHPSTAVVYARLVSRDESIPVRQQLRHRGSPDHQVLYFGQPDRQRAEAIGDGGGNRVQLELQATEDQVDADARRRMAMGSARAR